MNIPEMTDEQVDAIYKEWLYVEGHANELDLINMAVAARDAQYAAMAEQEPVAWIKFSTPPLYHARVLHTGPLPPEPFTEAEAIEYGFVPVYTHPAQINPAAQERAEPVAPAVGERELLEQAHGQMRHLIDDLTYAIDDDGVTRYIPVANLMFSNCIAALVELAPKIHAAFSATPPAPAQPSPEHADLMKFYGVDNLSALAEAQHRHIEKLQAKLPRNDQPAFTRVREG